MSEPKNIVVLGGPNGAGKTTISRIVLPELLAGSPFINADVIAAELSPGDPEGVAFAAGRLLIERIEDLSAQGASFAFETTLASRTFAPMLRRLASEGYHIHVVYMWLRDADLAVSRVARRVQLGGHNIPEDVVRRRDSRGLHNFFVLYRPLARTWRVYDNSGDDPILVARGYPDGRELVVRPET